jgi:hypothetical protein
MMKDSHLIFLLLPDRPSPHPNVDEVSLKEKPLKRKKVDLLGLILYDILYFFKRNETL